VGNGLGFSLKYGTQGEGIRGQSRNLENPSTTFPAFYGASQPIVIFEEAANVEKYLKMFWNLRLLNPAA
jgi:hypothetical protein